MAPKFLRLLPWIEPPEPPDPGSFAPASIMLASEGNAISAEAVKFAAHLARKSKAQVHVFVIARIWGSGLGLPHPGLMPTKREWKVHRDLVADTIAELKRQGVEEATGAVVSSRNAAGRIVAEAKRRKPGAIVMGAPAPRHWLVANFLWEHEPYRVRRLAEMPVYLITETSKAPDRRPFAGRDISSKEIKVLNS